MISSDRRPLTSVQSVRCAGRTGLLMAQSRLLPAHPVALRPLVQENRHFISHYDFAKGGTDELIFLSTLRAPVFVLYFVSAARSCIGVLSVLEALANLRLEVNKWYEGFYDSGSVTDCSVTEEDVRNR